MAPRANLRRRSRERNPVTPADYIGNRLNFQKPNLPPLQGTPSSRRQYTYGSAVEPPPPRPGRRGRAGNLASAVQGALSNRDGKEDEVFIDRSEALRTSHPEEVDEDELARSEADYRPSPSHDEQIERPISDALDKPEPPGVLPDPPDLADDESDLDDARSFGMESDYFDGATIDSVAADASPLAPAPLITSEPPSNLPIQDDDFIDVSAAATGTADATPIRLERRDLDSHHPQVERPSTRSPMNFWSSLKNNFSRAEVSTLATPPETDSQLSLEAEAAKRSSGAQIEASRSPLDRGFQTTQDRDSSEGLGQIGKPTTKDLIGELRRNRAQQQQQQQQQDARKTLNIQPANHDADPFSRTGERKKLFDLPPDTSTSNGDTMSSVKHTGDQQAKTSTFLDRRRREDEGSLRQSLTTDSWSEQQEEEEEEEDEDISWLQYLNPWAYLEPAWLSLQTRFGSLLHTLPQFPADALREKLAMTGNNIIHIIAALLALLIAVAITRVAYDTLPSELPNFSLSPRTFPFTSTLSDVAGRLGRYIPSFPRPSGDDWDDFPSLVGSDDSRFQKMEELLRDLHREVNKMRSSTKMHDESVKKLESVVPKLVHMPVKDGKPVVGQEFWHAIRDLIHQDDSFLALQKKGDEYDFANEKQWRSIVSRLTNDPAFASQLNQSVGKMEGEVEERLTGKLPAFWNTWVANNEEKISRLIGAELDKNKDRGMPRGVDKDTDKTNIRGGVVVTRDEFLRHLKNEFTAHRAEIRAEMRELEPRLEKLVKDSIALTKDDLPDGMAKADVENLVRTLVNKSLADMNLEALAKGKIHAHWDRDLKNQVNYFNLNSGARIDEPLTSSTYKPDMRPQGKNSLREEDPLDAIFALAPWLDEGDCWCGARDINARGNPYDVTLSVFLPSTIIPQHVVVEHILPGASTDPGARPKHIEVYAAIEDPMTRSRMRDFAAAHFPDDRDDWNFTPPKYPSHVVKVGQFVYEGAELHDGVHVHHLSPELIALGAETDQVIVRATSNYGAKLHTCFYRVRLYGQLVEGAAAVAPKQSEGWLWRW